MYKVVGIFLFILPIVCFSQEELKIVNPYRPRPCFILQGGYGFSLEANDLGDPLNGYYKPNHPLFSQDVQTELRFFPFGKNGLYNIGFGLGCGFYNQAMNIDFEVNGITYNIPNKSIGIIFLGGGFISDKNTNNGTEPDTTVEDISGNSTEYSLTSDQISGSFYSGFDTYYFVGPILLGADFRFGIKIATVTKIDVSRSSYVTSTGGESDNIVLPYIRANLIIGLKL